MKERETTIEETIIPSTKIDNWSVAAIMICIIVAIVGFIMAPSPKLEKSNMKMYIDQQGDTMFIFDNKYGTFIIEHKK